MKTFLAAIILFCLASTGALTAQSNVLLVSPTIVTFQGVPGSIFPQEIDVRVTSGSVPISITPESVQGWLGVSSTQVTASTTPATVGLEINPVSLPVGNGYAGTVTFSGPGVATVVINVILNVLSGQGGGFSSSPIMLAFSSTANGSRQSAPLSIQTSNTTATPINVEAMMNNGSGWLSVTPEAGTINSTVALNLTVFATPGNMAPNTYTGSINVFANGASTPSLSVPVTFTVNSQPTGPLAVSPNPLSFNFASGASPAQTQNLTISTNSPLVETVTLIPTPSGTWLTVGGSAVSSSVTVSANFPATATVGVNPVGLGIASSASGQVTLSSNALGSVTVPVQVSIGSAFATPLAASPDPLIFSLGTGSSVVSQQLTVSLAQGTFTSVPFIATVSQPSGQNWLSVSPLTVQSIAPNGSVALTVSVNPEGLTSGNYDTSAIVLTPTGSSQSASLSVPVSLTVGGTASINLSPQSLTFAYQANTAIPAPQTLGVSSSAASVGFSVTTSSAGNWLVVSPQTGTTSATPGAPTPITVQISPGSLSAGTYQGTIQVQSPQASNSPQTVNVTLVVSNQAVLLANPGNVAFNYQYQSATLPLQQIVNLASSGNEIPFTVTVSQNSGGDFVTVNPSSATTPASLTFALNQTQVATLTPGIYQATVQIFSNAAGNTPMVLGVILMIGNNPELVPSQAALGYNYEVGRSIPANQNLTLTSTGAPLTFLATVSSANCANFLSIANPTGTTPGTIVVSASTADAPIGICNGAVSITAAGAGNSPLTIPANLQVSNLPLLDVNPAYVSLTTQVGISPGSQTIALTSTDPVSAVSFNVTSATSGGGNWLQVGTTSGSTPQNLTLSLQTSSLTAGTYFASVTITPTALGAQPIVIPIQVVVSSSITSSISINSLTFNQPFGGSTPLPQSLQISTSTPGLSYSASVAVTTPTGGSWLILGATSSKTTPATLPISVDPTNLSPGTYSGTVTVLVPQATPNAQVVPVTFVIGPSVGIAESASSLSFTATAGVTKPPAAQTVNITSNAGGVAFTTSTNLNLITVTPASGTTPQALTIGLNATALAGLAASSTPYTGVVTVVSSSGTLTINVGVTIQPAAMPALGAVVNAASSAGGAVSPGEIITIFGSDIGPSTPAFLTLTASGDVATTLAGVSVTFNNVPAPLTYVSSGQINAIVPYEVSNDATGSVVVKVNGVLSQPFSVNITPTVPAIFSLSEGGGGQGAILNHDYSVNGPSNPAAIGSEIFIYATGEGLLTPQPATGSVTASTGKSFPMPVATPVTVMIGGQSAHIDYAGEAPGLVSGVLQVNVAIPSGVPAGSQSVVLTLGAASNSQQGITVSVK